MRSLLLLLLLLLAACTEATAARVDERTFQIQGPAMGILSDEPNRRVASRVCPKGYRVLNSVSRKGGPDRAAYSPDSGDVTTVWTIRCL